MGSFSKWIIFGLVGIGLQGCGNMSSLSGAGSQSTNSVNSDGTGQLDSHLTNLAHGKDLTLAAVGPAAIGINSFTNGSGATIYDETSASYIKSINATATYDGFTVNGPHLLIEGMNIAGTFDIYSTKPVVIRGCKIKGSSYWTIFSRDSAAPVYVLYSDISGVSAANPTDTGIVVSADNSVVYRSHIYLSGGDGFSIGAQNVRILENYVDQFIAVDGAHHDGLQAAGNNNGMLIARNKILLNMGETGAINLGPWGGSVATQVTVDSNYLAGGGYTFYGGGDTQNNILVQNNVFGQDFSPYAGGYGAVAYWEGGAGNTWTNNKFASGEPVTP
jgi:hypothetical protein